MTAMAASPGQLWIWPWHAEMERRSDSTPLSAQIEAERKAYYTELERAQRGDMDITSWVSWFLGCLGRAIAGSEDRLDKVLTKARFWERANAAGVNDASV
jgi:Fic family protein